MNKDIVVIYLNNAGIWLSQHRYAILVSFLFLKLLAFTSNGFWSGDFWEHSAVVKALSELPFNPNHPILLLKAPHAFMSPYSLFVATLSKISGLSSVDALAIFGLFNFLLFAYGLKLFCSIFNQSAGEKIAFYALLFSLFLWGENPWPYSGFFHIEVIGFVMPYPSTFSIALSLIGLRLFNTISFAVLLQPGTIYKLITVWFIALVVLLSHALTFIFLVSGLFFIGFLNNKNYLRQLGTLLLLLATVVLAAFCWPYYPVRELLLGSSSVYHLSNAVMYWDVTNRIWPNLLLSPFLFLSLRNRTANVMLMWITALGLIYFLGWLTGNYSIGRILSFCILLFHVLTAFGLIQLEVFFEKSYRSLHCLFVCSLALVLFAVSLPTMQTSLRKILTIANQLKNHQSPFNKTTFGNLVFINQHVTSNDLVIADIETSWMAPSFGGKVIGAMHPQAFVADMPERNQAITEFFNSQLNKAQRLEILRQYQPKFLILDIQNPHSAAIQEELSEFIQLIEQNAKYRLFSVRLPQ